MGMRSRCRVRSSTLRMAVLLLITTAGCRSREYVTLAPYGFLARYEVECHLAQRASSRTECRHAGRRGDWLAFDLWSGPMLTYGSAYERTFRTPAGWLPGGLPDRAEAVRAVTGPDGFLTAEGLARLERIDELAQGPPGVAVPELVGYLQGGTTGARWKAADALHEFGPAACDPLAKALDEAGACATPELIVAIELCGCDGLAPRLADMVMDGTLSDATAGEAVQALLRMGKANDVIRVAREHESATLRMFARALIEQSMA